MNKVMLYGTIFGLVATLFNGCSMLSGESSSEKCDKPVYAEENMKQKPSEADNSLNNSSQNEERLLERNHTIKIGVVGQGVAPMNTSSPAQAYALAKRAAVADGYRLIAEKVKGVRVEGEDLVSNMMIKRSSIRTSVNAMVKNANVVETNFKEGLCEVEMEVIISYSQFIQ